MSVSKCNTGDLPLSDDEILASKGLNAKLFHHQLMDLWVLCESTEGVARRIELVSRGKPQGATIAVTRAFVVLRIIRGPAGIKWAAVYLQEDYLYLLLSSESSGTVLQQLARSLLERNRLLARDKSWASYKEGRHLFRSGIYALEALASDAGAKGATRACFMLEGTVDRLLATNRLAEEVGSLSAPRRAVEVSPPAFLEDRDVCLALMAFGANAPVCLCSGTEESVTFANHYNGVNAGWGFLSWAVLSRRCRLGPLSTIAFDIAMDGQSDKAAAQLRALGIDSAEALEHKRATLERCAKPLLPAAQYEFHGRRMEEDLPLLPSLVFVHACEFAQVLNDKEIGEAGVKEVIGLPPDVYQAQVLQTLEKLMAEVEPDSTGRTSCYMQLLMKTVLACSTKWTARGLEKAQQRQRAEAVGGRPATQMPAATGNVGRGGKDGGQSPKKKPFRRKPFLMKSALARGLGKARRRSGAAAVGGQPAPKMPAATGNVSKRQRGGKNRCQSPGKKPRRGKGGTTASLSTYKEIVPCDLCGCPVRKDIILRHKLTEKCKRLTRRRAREAKFAQ